MDNKDGVRVVLTSPYSLPAVGILGYDILAGQSTSIGFDIKDHKRLSQPYSTCRDVYSMHLEGNLPYSFTECKNMCIHNLIIKMCGCFPTRYVARINYRNITSCGHDIFVNASRAKEKLDCQNSLLNNIETQLNYAQDCNCHVPCEDTEYLVTISQSQFPSQNSIASFWKVVIEDNPNRHNLKVYQYYQNLIAKNTSIETLKSWTHKHFLKLNIFANKKVVSVREQMPMYTLTNLLSQIGGCLGLWLGISIISLVEFFQLGFKLVYIMFRKIGN